MLSRPRPYAFLCGWGFAAVLSNFEQEVICNEEGSGFRYHGILFFAFTFILNRSMNLSGGHWLWSAALRYLFSFPILFVLLIRGHEYRPVFTDIKKKTYAMDIMEYGGIWLVLYDAVSGIRFCGKLVYGICLAGDHCGRSIAYPVI